MKKSDVVKRTEELVQPIIDSGGFSLWDVEYVKEGSDFYLRVYADKEGGINIDDCVQISRALEAKLDAEDFIEEAYILEVSSPGLTRKLKNDRDLERSIGKLVYIKLYKAEEGAKEHTGYLKSFDKESIVINYDKEADEAENISLSRANISSIRLEYEEI
ncbi:MAG: ribosome maturation factor RimP [Eubacterium sp.]|nr:ribosome maturation factor RimP [Eubacterium sp.]